MKKMLRGALLLLALGLSGCTGLEMMMVGSMLGGTGVGYGKPWLDKYFTPTPPAPAPTSATAKPPTP